MSVIARLRGYGEAISQRDALGWLLRSDSPDASRPAATSTALSVFSLNQRLIFYTGSGVLLGLMWVLLMNLQHSPETPQTLIVLSVGWMTGAALTSPFYLYMTRDSEAASAETDQLARICERFFQIDCAILVLMLAYGRWAGLPLFPLSYVLFANALVYSMQLAGVRRVRSLLSPIAALTVAIIVFSRPWPHAHNDWIDVLLVQGALLLVLFVASLSASVISWLRTIDQAVTHMHMQFLGLCARELSPHEQPDIRDLNRRLRHVMKRLAGPGDFRYDAAAVWWFEQHKDRGRVCLLGPHHHLDSSKNDLRLAQKSGLKVTDARFGDLSPLLGWSPGADSAAPIIAMPGTTILPITTANGVIGFLRLDGAPRRALSVGRERDFLRSLSAIISNAIVQWRSLLDDAAVTDMDGLFRCRSIDEVFAKAAQVTRQHLNAAASMVVFRPEPSERGMTIAASEGFDRSLLKVTYTVGEGQTGLCAMDASVIRCDDVASNRRQFSLTTLKALERSLGESVTSWMSIPIGPAGSNHGVIKVVNSRVRGWFSEGDEKLGKALALRLHVIVEKFLQIQRTEAARQTADENASKATEARLAAEQIAHRRQDDLMVITHQLQAPLASVVGAVTGMRRAISRLRSPDLLDRLDHVHALIEDGLTLCYGTFTTFGREAGREATFGEEEVNALDEVRKLCLRLQRTNARADLQFDFSADARFPLLRVDRNVFTSVFYSLIHNAMKYADPHSYVKLEASFERGSGRAALKVKSYGEPIAREEREAIFTKYHRGRVIEQTGRHHSGVGLGLWVARELLAAVGGEIHVELSEADPRLAVFVVHLPQAEGVAAAIA